MKKILLTGYSGMLGTEIYNKLNKKFKIYATSSKILKEKKIYSNLILKKIILKN